MTLFKVRHIWGDDYFYWAESSEEAKEMYLKQGAPKDIEILVERVWANNEDPKYRGYIVQL